MQIWGFGLNGKIKYARLWRHAFDQTCQRNLMTMRVISKRITFKRTFALKGLDGIHSPGTYSVETHEENGGFLSFLRRKRTSTWIRICRNPGTGGALQMMHIDPLELQTVLARDAASYEVETQVPLYRKEG
jgi:hypothetical protein